MDDFEKIIRDTYNDICNGKNIGNVADYIPELSCVDPDQLGVHIHTIEGNSYGYGDYQTKFSVQSIAKVLSLSLAYQIEGDGIWKRVGVEPSGNPYNSLVQLEDDEGIPRNPLINAGAIVVCDILVSRLEDPKADFLDFIQDCCGARNIGYNNKVADSEKSVGYRNVALCNYI